MREASPGWAPDLLRGAAATGQGVVKGTGELVPATGRGYGRTEASGGQSMGGTRGGLVDGEGGRVLRDMEEDLFEDDHIQVRFRGSGGGVRRDRIRNRGGRWGGIMVRWRWRR